MSQQDPSPEERLRMVRESLDHIKAQFKSRDETPESRLVERAKDITREIHLKFQNFKVAAGLGDDEISVNEVRSIVGRWYLEGFDKFTKEELQFLCAMMHTEVFLERIP